MGRRRRIRNELQELVLVAGMAATLGVVAFVLLGTAGLVVVLTAAIAVAVVRPRVSVGFVMWLYDAQPLPRWAAPRLHRIVDVLSERARLTGPPRLYYVRTSVPDAFVAGTRDEAALAVTDGLLRLLDGREVAGVVGHELGHLVDGDMSVMGLSDVVARLAQWMVWLGLWSSFLSVPLLLATGDARPVLVSTALVALPVVVTLAQLALSRSREYDADAAAVALTGDPEGLARALVMLDDSAGRIWERILVGRSSRPDPMLLRTHPSTEQRLRRLQDMRVEQERHHGESRPLAPAGYPAVTHGPRLRRTGVRWFTRAEPHRQEREHQRRPNGPVTPPLSSATMDPPDPAAAPGGSMLFHITQVHSPELCPRDAGGSNSLYDADVEGLTLVGRYGANAEHTLFYVVEADDVDAIHRFLWPGFTRCTSTITPVSEVPVPKP